MYCHNNEKFRIYFFAAFCPVLKSDFRYSLQAHLRRIKLNTIKLVATTAACILSVSLSAEAKGKYPDVGSIPVGEEFHDFVVPWGDGGKYMGKIALINTKDGLALCGAGYLKGIDKVFNDQMLVATYLKNNDKIIIENFRYFSHYRSKKDFKTAKAKCRLTTLKRKLKDSDDLELGRRSSRFVD
jgi:hypothetical protein